MLADQMPGKEIYVVDDDPAVRKALTTMLSLGGFQVTCFANGQALLIAARSQVPACIILDLNIPGKSGLDILRQLHNEGYPAPILMISGNGDIPTAVNSIKNGALDFIEKPFRGSELVARINDAIQTYSQRLVEHTATDAGTYHFPGTEPLTRRERDLLKLICSGATSKEAAAQLGISPRTVEDHRAGIMRKLGAKNAVDLIQIVMKARAPSDTGG